MDINELLYREYMEFFEHAERKRRWSVFDDVPWDLVDKCPRDPMLANYAETFCGVEMYLPDYVAQGLNLVREYFGLAWWQANWGYEESKHSVALREYLLRTGQRTWAQIRSYEQMLFSKKWTTPAESARQMAIYGSIQELTTFYIYKKQEVLARERGDELLAMIYQHIGRDEMAHARFYQKVMQVLLAEDPDGFKADFAHVSRTFKMPAQDLLPEFVERSETMRQWDVDRGAYLREVYFPLLKALGLTRHDLLPRAEAK